MTADWSLIVDVVGVIATLFLTWLIAQLGLYAAQISASRDSVVSDYALVEVAIKGANPGSVSTPATFREWKHTVLERRLELGKEATSARSLWRLRSGIAAKRTDGSYTEENQVAFHVADRMQILALAVFAGAVPPAYVISNLGDTIVDDWLVCEQWIASYREREIVHFRLGEPVGVHYHRRHAEWLAIIAALHMHRFWSYTRADLVLGFWGGQDHAWRRLKQIWELDKHDLTAVTKWYVWREVKRLAGRGLRGRARASRAAKRTRAS